MWASFGEGMTGGPAAGLCGRWGWWMYAVSCWGENPSPAGEENATLYKDGKHVRRLVGPET